MKLQLILLDDLFYRGTGPTGPSIGATGTGKTFTIANVIKNVNKPTLVLACNKIIARQLYSELKEFFSENHVCYFVSYYRNVSKTILFNTF